MFFTVRIFAVVLLLLLLLSSLFTVYIFHSKISISVKHLMIDLIEIFLYSIGVTVPKTAN